MIHLLVALVLVAFAHAAATVHPSDLGIGE